MVQVRFIGSNHVTSHELLAFNMVWLGLQGWELLLAVRRRISAQQLGQLVVGAVAVVAGGLAGTVVLLTVTGTCVRRQRHWLAAAGSPCAGALHMRGGGACCHGGLLPW